MIAYTCHPSASFLRRGGFRTFFQVSGDWWRLGLFDMLIIGGVAAWSYHDGWERLAEYSQEVQALAAAIFLALLIAGYLAFRMVLSVLALSLGVQARPMPTRVEIVPGAYVRCADMAEMRFEWSALTRAQAFDDMYILLFRAAPTQDIPVFISRDHLSVAEDDALAAALELA